MKGLRRRPALWIGLCAICLLALSRSRFPDSPLFLSASQQSTATPAASPKYDLLLRGGHVIDARNKISAVLDVAIAGGKIAAVAANLNPADALKTVDAKGLYVTPGLVDIHAHTYTGTGERRS